MEKYYPPQFKEDHFHCVHCGVYASQRWGDCFYQINGSSSIARIPEMNVCRCIHCGEFSYWYDERMIVPSAAPVPTAHIEMPQECLSEYNEARGIVAISPRAAAALIRLALQKLMTVLGAKGRNINDDIRTLVAQGLPAQVQQALDFCRVVGNNAVHPGEIDLKDTPEIAHQLFVMINFIVEDRIARPNQIAALYMQLPEGARKAIEERDGGKKT